MGGGEVTPLLPLAIALLALVLWWYRYGVIVSPDGAAYLSGARGGPIEPPFRWRLLPAIVGRWPLAWHALSWSALVASVVLVGAYAEQRGIPAWAAAALFAALPIVRGLVRMPLLPDHVGMAAALGCAVAPWWAVVPLAILAGACTEKHPVYAAVLAWSPLPLVGLAVPLLMRLARGGKLGSANDWRVMRELHNRAALHIYALPWGACLLCVLAPSWQLAAALALGYGQMLIATDRARLYMAMAPVVVVSALSVLPPEWWVVAVLVTVVNPASDWSAPWK